MSILLFLATAAWGQTLGSTLESVGTEAGSIVSRYQNGSSWGERTAVEDLKRLVTVSHQLSAAFSGQDARQVETLQRELMTAARRVGTSSVLLPESEQPKIQELVDSVEEVDERLTEPDLSKRGDGQDGCARQGGQSEVLQGQEPGQHGHGQDPQNPREPH